MAKAIWKYTTPVVDLLEISMPTGARVMTVQLQRDHVAMWAIVDPEVERERRRFAFYGTGQPMPEDPGAYVGTVQEADGVLVWHFFEVAP